MALREGSRDGIHGRLGVDAPSGTGWVRRRAWHPASGIRHRTGRRRPRPSPGRTPDPSHTDSRETAARAITIESMSRPPHARESVLDAFEELLIAEGERAATMDATARSAGVSKGGLLYHFASKDALEAGLVERLEDLVDGDIAAITGAAEGPIAYFLRSSVMQNDPLDRALTATSRLAQGGNAAAGAALRSVRDRWTETLRPHARNETALQLVMLVSDGLYFNNALDGGAVPGPVPQGAELDALIAVVLRAAERT